jgi:hypothetical protein
MVVLKKKLFQTEMVFKGCFFCKFGASLVLVYLENCVFFGVFSSNWCKTHLAFFSQNGAPSWCKMGAHLVMFFSKWCS